MEISASFDPSDLRGRQGLLRGSLVGQHGVGMPGCIDNGVGQGGIAAPRRQRRIIVDVIGRPSQFGI